MGSSTTSTTPFHETADAMEAAKEAATDAAKITLPINTEEKTTILLNVEGSVKELISALAKKNDVKGAEGIDASHLPNSITGVVIHYVVEGLKKDFDLGFEETPVCLKQRGGNSNYDKKVAGKKRLLTREQKNELLQNSNEFLWRANRRGDMSIENAMYAIKDAFERKQNFEEMGYILPTKKTEYPYGRMMLLVRDRWLLNTKICLVFGGDTKRWTTNQVLIEQHKVGRVQQERHRLIDNNGAVLDLVEPR